MHDAESDVCNLNDPNTFTSCWLVWDWGWATRLVWTYWIHKFRHGIAGVYGISVGHLGDVRQPVVAWPFISAGGKLIAFIWYPLTGTLSPYPTISLGTLCKLLHKLMIGRSVLDS